MTPLLYSNQPCGAKLTAFFLALVVTVLRTDALLSTPHNTIDQRFPHSRTSQKKKNAPLVSTTTTALHLDLLSGGAFLSVGVIGAGAALWLSGSEERARKAKYKEWEVKNEELRRERERLARVEPKETWTEDELAKYDGTDETGPILFAADGDVYNVWKGRHFYGPGCEYNIFAGRDATRLLAKQKLEEETEEESRVPLSIAEKATLQGWTYTFRGKYEIVGRLEGFDPSTTRF